MKGPARPIAVQRVIQALRTGGFQVYGDPDRQCDPGGSVVRLQNLFFSGPHENIGSADEVEQREGQVVCNVFRRTMAGITTRHPRRLYEFAPPDPTNKGAWFLVANVDCRVYTPRRPIVERFRTVMRALRQGLGR